MVFVINERVTFLVWTSNFELAIFDDQTTNPSLLQFSQGFPIVPLVNFKIFIFSTFFDPSSIILWRLISSLYGSYPRCDASKQSGWQLPLIVKFPMSSTSKISFGGNKAEWSSASPISKKKRFAVCYILVELKNDQMLLTHKTNLFLGGYLISGYKADFKVHICVFKSSFLRYFWMTFMFQFIAKITAL